jgi:Schlafen group 3, DNA/RNA helicase domain
MERQRWGWAGSVRAFLDLPPEVWIAALTDHQIGLLGRPPSSSQIAAWNEEGEIMRATFRDLAVAHPEVTGWGVVYEYELPLEGGRRPDVVVLAGGSVIVLEFKQAAHPQVPALDQVEAYARDLSEYHEATHGIRAVPVLVLTRSLGSIEDDTVAIVDPASLAGTLLAHASPGSIDVDAWVDADYAPLPMLVAAARRIFQNEPLPAIRRHLASSVPEAVELLGLLCEEAERDAGRVLAFIAGVPGSGKTLAGLTLVYERVSRMSSPATFLSGNGPLVEVLRDALQSKVFVRDLHAFIKSYGTSNKVPKEHVIVFDEAQRAWDADYMHYKKGPHRSEPDLLIDIGERLPRWAALVGLVGDGQEINAGEEAGIEQWNHAVQPARGRMAWHVHCPPRMTARFRHVPVEGHDVLDLTISLRSRRADRLHDWVDSLLAGKLGAAARLAALIHAEGFPMYLTRDLSEAKQYAWDRYGGQPGARYGLVASSRTQTYLPKFGVDSSYPATKKVRTARWYNEPLGHPESCCELRDVVTEFACQGLELDLPIVCWGDDVMWDGRAWRIRRVNTRYPLKDGDQIRLNAYRVLLTRGRDGLVIFIPADAKMDPTEHALLAAGVRPLPVGLALASEA